MKSILYCLRNACIFVAAASPAWAAPLPAVVDQVLQRHPDLRSAQGLLEASEAQIRQARSDFYPTFNLNYRDTQEQDQEASLLGDTQNISRSTKRSSAALRWNLFNGHGDVHRLRFADHGRDAAAADLDDARERIALDVTDAYAELVRQRLRLELTDILSREYEALRDSVRKRVDAGRVSPAELDQIQSELLRIHAQQSQLRGQLGGSENRYRQLTGQAPVNLSSPWLEAPEDARSQEQLLQLLETGNPHLRAALQRAQAQAEQVAVARSSYWPSLDLELDHRLHANIVPAAVTDQVSASSISLNLDIPLGGKNLFRIDEAVQRMKAAQAAAASLQQSLATDIGTSFQELSEARVIEPELLERVATTRRVYLAYRLQFDAGKRSLLDVASAQNERFMALADVIDNHHMQLLDQARVLSMVGKLRQTLNQNCHDSPLILPIGEKLAEDGLVTPESPASRGNLEVSRGLDHFGRIQ